MTYSNLTTENLSIGYGQDPLLQGLNLEAVAGELVCVMGPNGCGKSTLLRTMASLQAPLKGSLKIGAHALHKLGALEKARLISLVLTEHMDLGYLRVDELVAMGRYPYTGWRGRLRREDQQAIDQALHTTGLQDIASRPVQELSDGQRQKALIARALAQNGSVMILDEPLIHLDVGNKWEIMNLLRLTTRQHKKILLMATHEIDLSLRFADKLWLINREAAVAVGCPEDLVLNGMISATFDQGDYKFHQHADDSEDVQGPGIQLSGEGHALEWTRRGLIRAGYHPGNAPGFAKIKVSRDQSERVWTIEVDNISLACSSIEQVIKNLNRYT